jgi:transcriptional regulator with XRE-family HTH domain
MVHQSIGFGEDLRRRRLDAGLTLSCLARLVHYSKGQLSKVERGIKMPSRDLARLCEAALDAGGALAALFRERPNESGNAFVADDHGEEVWLMRLSADGQSWFHPMSRRQLIAGSAASIPGLSSGRQKVSSGIDDATLVGIFRSLFDQYRQLGQGIDPVLLLPALIAQSRILQELAESTGPRARRGLLILGSRYAEYIGWLVQEAGNDQAALWWTRRAADLAAAGDDPHFAVYGLVRHALIMLYRGDARQTIELARRAQDGHAPPRIRGLAAQREAQGHALAGDYEACMQCLERARIWLGRTVSDPDVPVIGTTNLADPTEMIRGWCLYDLGRPRAAAELIDQQLIGVPPRAMRTRVRYGVRGALAHAAAGEVEHACQLADGLLDAVTGLGSATIATDLHTLVRTLSRHPRNAAVRDLAPKLGTAFSGRRLIAKGSHRV